VKGMIVQTSKEDVMELFEKRCYDKYKETTPEIKEELSLMFEDIKGAINGTGRDNETKAS
jgi:hypothetical protein